LSNTSNRHFRTHVIVWFLLVAGIILAITGYSIYRSAEVFLIQKFQHQQMVHAQTIAGFIDGDIHRKFNSPRAMKTLAYQRYNNVLKKSMEIDKYTSFIYTINVLGKSNQLKYGLIPRIRGDGERQQAQVFTTGTQLAPDDAFYKLVNNFYKSGSKATTILLDDVASAGKYMSLAMIEDKHKNSVGLVVIEVSNRHIATQRKNLLASMLVTISLLFISLLVASIFFARKISRPFEQLTDAIERLIKNDFNFHLSLSGFGGYTHLAKQFNLMLLKLQVSRNELVSTNKAYSRFVPHQVLKLISPNGIKSINLGDCVEKEMTILFCDIRGFTQISESMPPHENFRFINRYLKTMVPVINQHGGTIDKYMGDGIMALFPNSADHALNAAVGMMESLARYNKKLAANNLPVVEIGLGLHTGKMMLGTVGTSSRMDVTAISDTVNAAARIEALTKTFKTPILISEQLRLRLKSFDKRNLRFIATCVVQGKSQPMTIYEVFSQDPLSVRNEKLSNQTMMIRGWEYYKDGDIDRAIILYQRLMEKSPMDKSLLALIEVVQKGRL